MNIRILCLFLLTVAISGTDPTPAGSAIRTPEGRWVFQPQTGNNDPVSILFLGGQGRQFTGQYGACQGVNGTVPRPRCLQAHVRADWTRNGNLVTRVCASSDDLVFRNGQARPSRRSDVALSTSARCKRQYHLRVWGDYNINRGYGYEEWSVGTIHREDRRRGAFNNHYLIQDWESSEEVLIFEMRTRPNKDGEMKHCTQSDYRYVPDQPRRIKRRYNDARLSRISTQHINPNAPKGEKCRGA